MANKEFQKNNETISPAIIAPTINGDLKTFRDFLEHALSQGGSLREGFAKLGLEETHTLTDILTENSKIDGVIDKAELVGIPGLSHKVNVTYVTCPKTRRKLLIDLEEKLPENGGKTGNKPSGKSASGGKPPKAPSQKSTSPPKKSSVNIIKKSIKNDVENDDRYDEVYGGKKKSSSK